MIRLSPNTDIIFDEISTVEAAQIVKKAGYNAIEFWDWKGKDINAISKLCEELKMDVVTFCGFIKPTLVDQDDRTEALKQLKESISVARFLRCSKLIICAGNELENIDVQEQESNLIEGLKECAGLAEKKNITLLLEPLNRIDYPGHFLNRSEHAARIIKKVGSENVRMLFDIYHQYITEGNLSSNITKYINVIGHFHIADAPGRLEPGTGDIRYTHIVMVIVELCYNGYIGLEFTAQAKVEKALDSIKSMLAMKLS
ncbi:MAG: TIM barrel protein [Planctomycetota bacterium]